MSLMVPISKFSYSIVYFSIFDQYNFAFRLLLYVSALANRIILLNQLIHTRFHLEKFTTTPYFYIINTYIRLFFPYRLNPCRFYILYEVFQIIAIEVLLQSNFKWFLGFYFGNLILFLIAFPIHIKQFYSNQINSYWFNDHWIINQVFIRY